MTAKKPCILITRPNEDAAPLAEALTRLGYDTFIEPMLEIRFREEAIAELNIELGNKPQAILITSANGARTLAKSTKRRDISIITVGEHSKAIAEKFGFSNVKSSGGGDVEELAEYVRENLVSENGSLLHISGSVVAGDLKGMLAKEGFSVKRITLYEAWPIDKISEKLKALILNNDLDVVLFYSKRTAETFIKIIADAGLEKHLERLTAFCISKKIEESTMVMKWKDVYSTSFPSQDDLLKLMGEKIEIP